MANDAALGIRGVPGGAAASGNSVAIQFSNVPFARGSQDVHEVFGEVLVPLLAEYPFVKQLNLDIAYRWARYSGSGVANSWKEALIGPFMTISACAVQYPRTFALLPLVKNLTGPVVLQI